MFERQNNLIRQAGWLSTAAVGSIPALSTSFSFFPLKLVYFFLLSLSPLASLSKSTFPLQDNEFELVIAKLPTYIFIRSGHGQFLK